MWSAGGLLGAGVRVMVVYWGIRADKIYIVVGAL